MESNLDDETLQRLYAWIDEIPLSRPKRNIARDFSDGILTAEVVAYYFPKLVDMHNYSAANSVKQKQYNWNTLNRKVLRKLHVNLSKEDMDDLVQCRSGAVEKLLVKLQVKIANYKERVSNNAPQDTAPAPAASQYEQSKSMDQGIPQKMSEVRDMHEQFPQSSSKDSDAENGVERSVASSEVSSMSAHEQFRREAALVHEFETRLQDKDETIAELQETIKILEQKTQKLEQLVRLKDGKIQSLTSKMRT